MGTLNKSQGTGKQAWTSAKGQLWAGVIYFLVKTRIWLMTCLANISWQWALKPESWAVPEPEGVPSAGAGA